MTEVKEDNVRTRDNLRLTTTEAKLAGAAAAAPIAICALGYRVCAEKRGDTIFIPDLDPFTPLVPPFLFT